MTKKTALLKISELTTLLERAIQRETGRGVCNLSVEIDPETKTITTQGRTTTYYSKQLAQHAVNQFIHDEELQGYRYKNDITAT